MPFGAGHRGGGWILHCEPKKGKHVDKLIYLKPIKGGQIDHSQACVKIYTQHILYIHTLASCQPIHTSNAGMTVRQEEERPDVAL